MSQVLVSIKLDLKHLNSKRELMLKNMVENYCYTFAWNGEELYFATFKCERYSKLLSNMELMTLDAQEEHLQNLIGGCQLFISRSYNVRTNSTGSLHREASTFEYIANMEMVEIYSNYLKLVQEELRTSVK